MNNTNMIFIEIILCLILLIILYKKYKLDGVYIYIITTYILSTLMSLKTIELYNYELNLGIVPYTSIFIASNIIVQKKGPEEIKKLILILLTISILSYLLLFTVTLLTPSNINLFTSASYNNIFIDSPRIYFANIVTILYTLFFNSKLYYYLKKEKNKIIISNIFSSIIIQFLVAIIFDVVSYAITKELIDILKLIMIRYIVSLIVCIISTIPLYIINNIKEK